MIFSFRHTVVDISWNPECYDFQSLFGDRVIRFKGDPVIAGSNAGSTELFRMSSKSVPSPKFVSDITFLRYKFFANHFLRISQLIYMVNEWTRFNISATDTKLYGTGNTSSPESFFAISAIAQNDCTTAGCSRGRVSVCHFSSLGSNPSSGAYLCIPVTDDSEIYSFWILAFYPSFQRFIWSLDVKSNFMTLYRKGMNIALNPIFWC